MKNLKCFLLTLFISSNLYPEGPVVPGSGTFKDVPLTRVLWAISDLYDVQFISDPSIELPRVSFVFESNESLSECLTKMQNDLIEDGVLFTYIKKRDLVFVTEFSDKDLLKMILSRTAQTENDVKHTK